MSGVAILPKVSTIYTSLDCGGAKRDASNEPCYILSKGQIAAGLSWEATGEFTADQAPGTARPSSVLPALCPWGPRACGEQHPTHSPSEGPDTANFSSIILSGNPTSKQGPEPFGDGQVATSMPPQPPSAGSVPAKLPPRFPKPF